ncbi:MAG: acetylglutamate kinase [Candidatus Omnitrophica bacterium]|nr:acetylglutamate kinase [Candidatus Omnitrophota bacterium]MCM8825995.1 acetylglutamate kinase [Candidatus Omnitrophota bacterium]
MVKEAIKKADVLIEALPYIEAFHQKIIVIKYGGSILAEERIRRSVLEDIAFLRYTGIRPIIVHGGGPTISERLRELKISSEFIDGCRVTDHQTLKVVEEELDKLNDTIVKEISLHGIKARGFKKEDGLIIAEKKKSKFDLGFVGEVVGIDREKIDRVIVEEIAVVSPMGVSKQKVTFNINADEVACFLASELKAEKLVFLTNVLGVMRNPGDENSLIPTLYKDGVEELIEDGVIDEGMIPKVRSAIKAVNNGVKKVHIIDAKIPHALLLEIFTPEGIGTEIIA